MPAAKRRKTSHPASSNHTTTTSSSSTPLPMKTVEPVLPPQLFFTTQRFKTPAKPSEHTSLPSPSSSSSSSSSRLKTLPLPHASSRTPPSSDQGSPPVHPRTPRLSKNPHIYGPQERQTDAETSLITAETPMQHKNREFRRGKSKPQDPLAPTKLSAQSLKVFESTPSRSRRGSRASSIGSGHEALPHPRIPPSTLCRHIRTDLPPAMRCRTLISWSTQKAEDLTYTTLNPQHFKPTRFILEELPKTILNSFNYHSKTKPLLPSSTSSSKPNQNHHSKFILKIVKSSLKNFIKGICENQVEISWGSSGPQLHGADSTSDDEEDHGPTVDFDSLPVHPQDIKNERKIKELEDWRTRMSYEDNARQYQLNRYNNLIEKLNQEDEASTSTSTETTSAKDEAEDLGRIDTTKLVDRESILEFGRLLRRREAAQSGLPKSIDTVVEHGTDWSHLSSNVGTIAENMHRIEGKVTQVSKRSQELLMSSTYKLGQVTTLEGGVGGMSSIEAKMLLSSVDGIQLCLKSLNLVSPLDDLLFSDPADHSLFKLRSSPWFNPPNRAKRDLLRALSSCHP